MQGPFEFIIGRTAHTGFDTLAQISAFWEKLRDDRGWKGSDAPTNWVRKVGSKENLAHVSYNGRVWAGTTWRDGDVPLYDPYPPSEARRSTV